MAVANPPLALPAAPWWAALRRHAHLLPVLAVVALIAVPAPVGTSGGGSEITLADAASGFLVVFCAVRLLRDRSRPLGRTAAVVLGLPVIGVSVAAIASQDPAASLAGVPRYLQIFVLVPGALVLLVRDRRDLSVVAGALVALALVEGAVGVAQYATGTGASYAGQDVRAVGTFGPTDVMGMATVVAYGLVVAAGHGLAAGRSPGRRAAALLCAGALTVPLVLSFSRGAWIATVAALLLQLLLSGPRRAVVALSAAAALGIVVVGGLGVGSSMVTERAASISEVAASPDQSVTDRYTLWAAATGMWRSEPLTGVGLKGFPAHRDTYASLALSSGSDTEGAGRAFERQPLLSPHNMYLLLLSEQGLLGLVTVAGSWAALLVLGLRRLRDARAAAAGSTGVGLGAAALMAWQLIDFAYADIGGPSTAMTGIMLGLAASWSLGRAVTAVPRGRAAHR